MLHGSVVKLASSFLELPVTDFCNLHVLVSQRLRKRVAQNRRLAVLFETPGPEGVLISLRTCGTDSHLGIFSVRYLCYGLLFRQIHITAGYILHMHLFIIWRKWLIHHGVFPLCGVILWKDDILRFGLYSYVQKMPSDIQTVQVRPRSDNSQFF